MIVDFHTHIHPPELRERREHYLERDATFRELYSDPRARLATAEELLAAMDEDGVDVSVVMGAGWADKGLARESNDYIIEAVGRYPKKLVGFASVNPAWGERAAVEVERCAEAGLRGVGELHPDTQGFDLGDADTMAPLMEVVRRRGLIVTTHSSEPVGHTYSGKGTVRPETLWRFIESYPDVTLVCAHWGGGLPFYALMPEVAEGLRNVYFDTAASPFLYRAEVFETVVDLVRADRVLLGSDYPLLRTGRLMRQIEDSSLSGDDKKAIVSGNAIRLLGL
jgi:predicted TIM-barrel fold metal-dependent hydrolase